MQPESLLNYLAFICILNPDSQMVIVSSMADRIGLTRHPTVLALGKPYILPGFEPDVNRLEYKDSLITFSDFVLKICSFSSLC